MSRENPKPHPQRPSSLESRSAPTPLEQAVAKRTLEASSRPELYLGSTEPLPEHSIEIYNAIIGKGHPVEDTLREKKDLENVIKRLQRKMASETFREQTGLGSITERIGTLESDFNRDLARLIEKLSSHLPDPEEAEAKDVMSTEEGTLSSKNKKHLVKLHASLEDIARRTHNAFALKTGGWNSFKELKGLRSRLKRAEGHREKAFKGVRVDEGVVSSSGSNRPSIEELAVSAETELNALRGRLAEYILIGDVAAEGTGVLEHMEQQFALVQKAIRSIENFEKNLHGAITVPDYDVLTRELPDGMEGKLRKKFSRNPFNPVISTRVEGDEIVEEPNRTRWISQEERDAFYFEAEQMRTRLLQLADAYESVLKTCGSMKV